MGTLPTDYQRAEWRCTLPVDPATQRMGIGLNFPDGSVARFSISCESARKLSASIAGYLLSSQSEMSSDMPSDAVSTPDDGEIV